MKLLSRYVTGPRAVSARILFKGAADAGGKLAMLVITVVAARQLNPDPFAVLAYAMATGWLLGVATDAGLSMHLARETARHPARARQLWREVFGVRAGLAFLAATLVAVFARWFVPAHWQLQFILIVMVQLTNATIETMAHYFRGLGRSEVEAVIHTAHRVATLMLAVIALWWWRRLDYLGVAMLIPAALALITTLVTAYRMSGSGSAAPAADAMLTPRDFVQRILPLGAGVLISALYFRIDVYFIQQWHGVQPVGGYNAAFRLIEALRLLPAAVMAVTFPMLVNAGDTRLVQRIGGGLAAAGVILTIACVLGAPVIVPGLYGEFYRSAVPAFAVLSVALPLFFLNYALTHQVIGWDGQRAYLLIATLALVANVGANLALVPTQGIVGAAIATVLTEVVVTAGCVYALWAIPAPRPVLEASS